MSAVIRAAINSLTNALATDGASAMIAWLDANDRARPGPAGCVGHCMIGSALHGRIARGHADRAAEGTTRRDPV
jgi:hypothetical protein